MTRLGWITRMPASRVTVLAAVIATVVVDLTPLRAIMPSQPGQMVLIVGAAGVTGCGALISFVLARLDGSRGIAGLAAAVTLYGMVVLPATVIAFTGGTAAHMMSMLRLVGCAVFLVLMAFALLPRQPAWTMGWPGALLATGVTVVVATLIVSIPALDRTLTSTVPAGQWVLAGWGLISVVYVYYGFSRRHPLVYRLGIGMALIAAAQLMRETTGAGLGGASLRLLGAIVICAALAKRLREALQSSQLRVDRIAELDHELHNVLSGLDGMTHVLSHGAVGDRELLSEAVREEITRLRDLLDQRSRPPGCAVEPVLTRLVTARRVSGLDIELDVEPGLRTSMPADTFAQVVTNLLANCERHAPGAKVWVSARSRGRTVQVEVCDDGPGLAPGSQRGVFRRGAHDPSRGGSGIGLHLSAQLAGASGGSLSLRPAGDGKGCVAALAVPAGRQR